MGQSIGQVTMVPWISPDYELRSRNAAARKTINFYMQSGEGQAKTQWILAGCPGTNLFIDLESLVPEPDAIIRGIWFTSTSQLYVVFGSVLLEIQINTNTGNPVAIQRAILQTNSGFVSICDNGKWLTIVDGYTMYNLNLLNNSLAPTPVLPFTNPTQVVYYKQRVYCINNSPATTQQKEDGTVAVTSNCLWWSEVGLDGPVDGVDHTTAGGVGWDSLSFAAAETSSDTLIRMGLVNGQLWLFGPRSYEIWGGSTNPDQPMVYEGGSATEYGCESPYSVSTIGGKVFWVGASNAGKTQVFMNQGYSPLRISNHSIEYRLNEVSNLIPQATAWTYSDEGHVFYCLTVPPSGDGKSGDFTVCYDTLTGVWHDRSTREPNSNKMHRWQCLLGSYAFDKIITGTQNGTGLLYLDLDTYTDYDLVTKQVIPLVAQHTGPQLWADLKYDIHDDFVIDMQTGVGLQTGQGKNPQIMLQYSDDAGYSWSNEMWRDMNPVGVYGGRVRWRRLGMSRYRLYRITISDPILRVILEGRATMRQSKNA